MKTTSQPKISSQVFWYGAKQLPQSGKPLQGDLHTAVVVIGGGMAGLSCAQRLHEAGVQVVLLEKAFCGSGASGKTSGFVTPDSEIELSSLLATYGPQKAKQMWEFVLSGVAAIKRNILQLDISCDYQVQDSLFIANTAAGFAHVTKEFEARNALGYASTLYAAKDCGTVIGSMGYTGAVRYPETFGMNSFLYCQALRDHLRAQGVQIYENTPVESIDDHTVMTPHGRIAADQIIVCTDKDVPHLSTIKKEIYHVQTFLGITQPLTQDQVDAMFPAGKMMVWDTDLVYNYFRITGDNRLLIGGGDVLYTYARHTNHSTARFARRLKAYINRKFSGVEIDMEYVWPGMLGVSKDLLPIMGADQKTLHVWSVGAATGLPWASALGTYAAERLIRQRSEFDEDFSPLRHFVIGSRMQSLLSTPVTYAVSHGIAKYG